ncbi:hypothetical protein BH09PSE2_BH09PSE2_02410 [soil metagenome]
MLALVREGEFSPGAEAVATRADVGLRTVFRHFNDMDTLYREMSSAIEAQLMSAVARPLRGATWRERLIDLVDRRSNAFETIAPFRAAADLHRLRSPVLQETHARLNGFLRAVLVNELPDAPTGDAAARADLLEGLDMLLSYEVWRRLRADQGLDPDAARAVIVAAVRRLLNA